MARNGRQKGHASPATASWYAVSSLSRPLICVVSVSSLHLSTDLSQIQVSVRTAGYYYYEPYFPPPSPDLFKELDGDDSDCPSHWRSTYESITSGRRSRFHHLRILCLNLDLWLIPTNTWASVDSDVSWCTSEFKFPYLSKKRWLIMHQPSSLQ